MPTREVHFLPSLISAETLRGRLVVVIDVLRATTTVTQAIAAGAKWVVPCLEVEQARQLLPQFRPAVLGGERGGKKIEGFHMGNSPAEYTAQSVGGKTVVFTTTNGTRAMQVCSKARRVLLGSMNNLSAIARAIDRTMDVSILCAGTDGHVTSEDVLVAGAILQSLNDDASGTNDSKALRFNDEAMLAMAIWNQLPQRDTADIESWFASSRGGRNLIEIGMGEDVHWAAQIDTIEVVAELSLAKGLIQRTEDV